MSDPIHSNNCSQDPAANEDKDSSPITGDTTSTQAASNTTHVPGSSARLVGVYNANGGLVGELAYLKGKITKTAHCALCDITHGLNPLGKAAWKSVVPQSPLPITTVHLNEMDARTAAMMAAAQAPAVVLLDEDPADDRVLVTADELASCDKDPNALLALLKDKLNRC